MGKRVVVALGGNALGNNLTEQMTAVKQTSKAIADLIEAGYEVILSHGNGPQVGMIQLAMEEFSFNNPQYPVVPLSVCVAMSQSYIGYDLENALQEELRQRNISKAVTTIVTQVVVDENDPAFKKPTKPIGRFMTKEEAEQLVKELSKQKGLVTDIQEKVKTENAPLPYDLTEIQREANQRFQFSAKKTLSLVQSLYETHKIVSYPRTDSKYLTTDMKGTMKERLQAIADFSPEVKGYLKNGAVVKQQKVFQNAKVTDHHGLIPTEQRPRYEKLSNDEQKIYQMIVQRFLGLFAEPNQTKQTKVTVAFGKETFVFHQNKVVVAGWKTTAEQPLSTVQWQKGMTVAPNFTINKELTSPPKPLTEGTLLGKMEKHSLGTPATRAEIIEKLIKSELMERTNSGLSVSAKGKQLLDLVNPSLVTPELTEKWETSLEAIASGQQKSQLFLKDIEEDTKKLVREIKQSEKKYQDFSITQKKCPDCGSNLREKNTKDGKIYVCTNQECSYRRRKDPKVSNHRCPQCHKKMVIIEGKNGRSFKCKFCSITEKIPDKKERKQKMTKHEERRLMKKYSQPDEPEESALAQALKAAMNQE